MKKVVLVIVFFMFGYGIGAYDHSELVKTQGKELDKRADLLEKCLELINKQNKLIDSQNEKMKEVNKRLREEMNNI